MFKYIDLMPWIKMSFFVSGIITHMIHHTHIKHIISSLFAGPSPQQQTRMRPGAPVRAAGCSSAVAQCAPSSQSARLQWASPSVRLRASVSTDLRVSDTPPQTRTDTSSARPQQDARGKERACGTAEHFSGEHRPAIKWWVCAPERSEAWFGGFGFTRRLDPDSEEYSVLLHQEVWWRWRMNPQNLPLYPHCLHRDGAHPLSECLYMTISNVRLI